MISALYLLLAAPVVQASPAPSGGLNSLGLIFQFGAIFLVFYFLFIRPQQKKAKADDQRRRQLKRGDEIVTAGGIIGEVVHIKEEMQNGETVARMDDRITIKSGESRLIVVRGRIDRVLTVESTPETGK